MIYYVRNNVTQKEIAVKQDLISKKEILDTYDISYGALYRWKRKGLIPEDWFIKKSTFTGQETFFPRELICERISLIKAQKDDASLDDLAKRFSSESKKNATLIIETAYGKKIFYLNEIISVTTDDGSGNITDKTIDVIGGKK